MQQQLSTDLSFSTIDTAPTASLDAAPPTAAALKTRPRKTAIPVSLVTKRLVYYLENLDWDTRITVGMNGLIPALLHCYFHDKSKVLSPDYETQKLNEYTEKLPLFVSDNHHITERNIVRFNDLVRTYFIDHVTRLSFPLHKEGHSRSAIIITELDRAGIAELVTKDAMEKAVGKRARELGIPPYKIMDLGGHPR